MSRRRYPVFTALAVQGLAVVATALIVFSWIRLSGFPPSIGWILPLNSVVAVVIGSRFRIGRGWYIFHAGFIPGVIGLHMLAMPAWAYFSAFLAVLLLNWNSFRHGVPLYLTSRLANQKLAELLRTRQPDFSFIDLGCGLAGTLCCLARQFPQAQFTGVETAPLTFVLAWLRSLTLGNCRIRYRSLWDVSLTPYDVVYCFLSPLPMASLWGKANAELAPNAMLISNTFAVPGALPDQEIALGDWRGTRLLVWTKAAEKNTVESAASLAA